MKRIPELDGIRGVAIAMVLFFHYFVVPLQVAPRTAMAYLQASGRLAWTGVDLFFVLSGFLIGGILLDSRNSPKYFSVFYTRRFFRIVPIYVAVLGATAIFVSHSGSATATQYGWSAGRDLPWWPYVLFVQNFWIGSTGVFGLLAVTWSLAVEEQFYLTLPAIVRFVKPSLMLPTIVCGIAAAPAIRLLLYRFAPGHPVSMLVLMPCRTDALLLGVLAAWLMRNERTRRWIVGNPGSLWASAIVLLIGAGLLTKYFRSSIELRMISVGYTWMALLYFCVILLAVTQPQGWLGACLRWRWLRALGTIAYGVYLLHFQILVAAFYLFRSSDIQVRDGFEVCLTLGSLFVTLAICCLSWSLFEKNLIRLGHRLSN